jgi:adenylate kinase family enzyme
MLKKLCSEINGLPEFICINEIKKMDKNEFIIKYGVFDIEQLDAKIEKFETYEKLLEEIGKFDFPVEISKPTKKWFDERIQKKTNNIWLDRMTKKEWKKQNIEDYRNNKLRNISNTRKTHLWNLCYDSDDNIYISLRYTGNKILPSYTTNYINKIPYIIENNIVKYSILKQIYWQQDNTSADDDSEYVERKELPDKYYWKTVDDWLYFYDKDKPEIYSFDILSLPTISHETESIGNSIINNITNTIINDNIIIFNTSCCKKTDIHNLRFGISDIYKIYQTWCINNNKECLKKTKFKEEFEKLNYKEEESKGIDINKKPGKRGYNLMVSI